MKSESVRSTDSVKLLQVSLAPLGTHERQKEMKEVAEEQQRGKMAGEARVEEAGAAGDVTRAASRLTRIDPAAAPLGRTVRRY